MFEIGYGVGNIGIFGVVVPGDTSKPLSTNIRIPNHTFLEVPDSL
jgi:hypothetical protein